MIIAHSDWLNIFGKDFFTNGCFYNTSIKSILRLIKGELYTFCWIYKKINNAHNKILETSKKNYKKDMLKNKNLKNLPYYHHVEDQWIQYIINQYPDG